MRRLPIAVLMVVLAGLVVVVGVLVGRSMISGSRSSRNSANHSALAADQRVAQLETRLGTLEGRVDALPELVVRETIASWYGPGFHGRQAADGSTFDENGYTAAHRTLPFGTIVVFEYRGRRAPAVISDRGPFVPGREYDMSLGLARRLGFVERGVAPVRVYVLELKRVPTTSSTEGE